MSLLTFFLCHLGAPCATATIKIIEAAKIKSPKRCLGEQGSSPGPCGHRLWDAPCREKGLAALGGTTPAVELGSTDGELCSNNKAELFQRCRKCKALGPPDLGKLLRKNLIQSDRAPPVLSGLPSSPDKMPLLAFHGDQ